MSTLKSSNSISFQVSAGETMFKLIKTIPTVEETDENKLKVPIKGARTKNGGKVYLYVEKEKG